MSNLKVDTITSKDGGSPNFPSGLLIAGEILNLEGGFLPYALFPPGTIIQLKSVTKSDPFVASNTAFAPITGLSVSITPKFTTSDIFIIASVSSGGNSDNSTQFYRLMRDLTPVGVGDEAGSRRRISFAPTRTGESGNTGSGGMTFQDSPGTTAPLTYSLEIATQSTSIFVNRTQDDLNTNERGRSISTLTVMEIRR